LPIGRWKSAPAAVGKHASPQHGMTMLSPSRSNNLIRLTNRIGRGYSFNAIRAKVLYAETGRQRPKAGLLRFSMKSAAATELRLTSHHFQSFASDTQQSQCHGAACQPCRPLHHVRRVQ